jgi:hypothetical protein
MPSTGHATTSQHGAHLGDTTSQAMQECIQRCMECHRICLETVTHCLQMGGPHAEACQIRLLLDCAQVCETSANFMVRGSDLHARTCAVCTEVCERSAADCARFGDDPVMQRCAEVCRRCAESCRRMAASA